MRTSCSRSTPGPELRQVLGRQRGRGLPGATNASSPINRYGSAERTSSTSARCTDPGRRGGGGTGSGPSPAGGDG